MPSRRLLLVAPDTDLRRSLVFALETDGFTVVVCDAPPARAWLISNRFDCTVVDQKALVGPEYESIAFCIKARPVVLVAAKPQPWLVEWVAEVVQMPIAAGAVTMAIKHATAPETPH
jgi:hypothetical protein